MKSTSTLEKRASITTVLDESRIWPEIYGQFIKLAEKYKAADFYGIRFDLTRIQDKRYFVEKAYQLIESQSTPTHSNAVQTRVLLVRWLERCLGTEFQNTKDFKQKIRRYLKNTQGKEKKRINENEEESSEYQSITP